ncbi:acyl-CoA dehydrogenase family protein [Labrys monachus]|uniref:Alkylation response protein AidB-like acyl-CoA dehydrogenase n=1 Tax=Labrys monachus TaxID=217067 RepID=A0ABU0FFZ4_9HYPH|nr:acyl-CoA dehydrogenase family protein [Labrys monachus]MDQ0392970.1 alkylation response protein AidB-like acyl-CoA dehydrogenase [Labrys monachus]
MLKIVEFPRPRSEPGGEGQHAPLAERVRDFAALAAGKAEQADADGFLSPDVMAALHDQGLAMAPFPPMYGGEGLNEPERHGQLCATLRAIGAADLSVARLFEGHVNAVALVCRYGTAPQVSVLARKVESGALSGVWGADDAKGLRAVEDGDSGQWRLEGRKILASGAGFVTQPLVTATSEAGQILCLVDLSPGERSDTAGWTAQGMRSSATGTVDFSGLVLPAGRIIGSPGDFTRQPHFSGGAWRFCAVHVGAMERLADLFRDHLTFRRREGDPYQMQRVAQCVAAVTTARFWVEAAACGLASPQGDADRIVAFANLTRMVTERAALDVMEAVHRGVGLGSFMRPSPIERISRDLATYLRQPVPDLAMADAARSVLASEQPTSALWEPVG